MDQPTIDEWGITGRELREHIARGTQAALEHALDHAAVCTEWRLVADQLWQWRVTSSGFRRVPPLLIGVRL